MDATYKNWEYKIVGHCILLENVFPSWQASIPDAPPAVRVAGEQQPERPVVEELRPRNPWRAGAASVQKQPWIRPGWTYIERTRKTGKHAGRKYREYFDPAGNKYRARNEALKVLERSN